MVGLVVGGEPLGGARRCGPVVDDASLRAGNGKHAVQVSSPLGMNTPKCIIDMRRAYLAAS
jgi:hypothetical protein